MIKKVATYTSLYTFLASSYVYFRYGQSHALSLFLGGAMMLLNIGMLRVSWGLIFSKKSIALVVFTIIFKYLIFGAIFWFLMSSSWLSPSFFLVGLASLVAASLAASLKKK